MPETPLFSILTQPATTGGRKVLSHASLGWTSSYVLHGLALAGLFYAGGDRLSPETTISIQPGVSSITLTASAASTPALQTLSIEVVQPPAAKPVVESSPPSRPVLTLVETAVQHVINDRVEQELAKVAAEREVLAERVDPSPRNPEIEARKESESDRDAKQAEKLKPTSQPTPESEASADSVAQQGAKVDRPPQPLETNIPPVYPPTAWRQRHEGRVLLLVTVAVDGTVASIELRQTSGFDALDDAAREAVSRWKFRPARRLGTLVPSAIEVPLRFELSR